MEERNKRNRPRLDDKILTSWNGLMLKGLTDAYRYVGNPEYLDLALKNGEFINTNLMKEDGGLYHNYKNGKSTINGYLEDYASVIEAYLGLYEITFDEKWLKRSKALSDHCLTHFYDAESGMFFFTAKEDDFVIRRTIETTDNVVPSSNSIMAKNLFKLSRLYPDNKYEEVAIQMLKNLQDNLKENAQSHANWLQLAFYFDRPFYEVAIVGKDFKEKAQILASHYLPNSILAGTLKESTVSVLENRYKENETLIYVCEHGSCKLPLTQADKALTQLPF
ncbi:thioredoxin domain-containing protein [Maribacter halichondriae]|uniref:thioredoxin domain-containing protein n=1 Tax=Maribacter halichondriae TaxID=2980554 RepID=UPI0030762E27